MRPRPAVPLTGALLTLLVANIAIWQKKRLIAEGEPVFVALAPADPRSLMQGDSMRLNFALPQAVSAPLLGWHDSIRPRLVARLDATTRITMPLRLERDRYDQVRPPAAGEILLELTPKDGRRVLVTDAWFFKEGQARRFAAARFGEFRVLKVGRALLVGVTGADLQAIQP